MTISVNSVIFVKDLSLKIKLRVLKYKILVYLEQDKQ